MQLYKVVFYSVDISVICCISHKWGQHFCSLLWKSYITWFYRDLLRVSPLACPTAVGWLRAPAVLWVQGKYFSLYITHILPSLSTFIHPAIQPSLCWCQIQMLSRGRLTVVWGTCKPALAKPWKMNVFLQCALGEVIKPPSKGTKSTCSL